MKNYLFPTLIVDNFLSDPDQVVEYSKTLDYEIDKNYAWPGKRSKPLHEINYNLFNFIGNKILSCFNVEKIDCTWKAIAQFQSIDNKYISGWTHSDPNVLTAIIYLNKDYVLDSGTSLNKPKKLYNLPINIEKKKTIYKKIATENDYNFLEDINYLHENNQLFEETLLVKNLYNRLFVFEGSNFHTADQFNTPEARLTLIYFFTEINIRDNRYPMVSVEKLLM